MASNPDELQLVDRVFLRIGSAATDSALEAELNKFLPPIIQKLASPNDAVRKKVMELLIHVNRRVKSLEHIQLPVEALLKQFQDPSATSFVTNFAIIYIKMGYPRLHPNKQVELLPSLINCLQDKPPQHQDSLLLLMAPVFGHVKIPETPEKTASLFDLRERPLIAKLLVDFMLDVLLLPYGSIPLSHQSATNDDVSNDPVPGVPSGMSISSFNRVCGENPLTAAQLEKLKISFVKFLSSEVLPPTYVALPLVVASSDTRFSVTSDAEMALRRLDSVIDWDNSGFIASIYVLFLGTLTPLDRTAKEKFKNPSNTRIRLKLMIYLMKAKQASNYAPLALKVFEECVWGPSANNKLKQQGVRFLQHICFHADTEKLEPVGAKLFSGIVRVIEEEQNDTKTRTLAYGALAKLSLKLPALLLSHPSELHYLQTLMDALIKEEGDVLLAVQEALSMVAPVCKRLKSVSQDQLCLLLNEHVMHDNPQLRRTAVQYAASVFESNHVPSRFILMVATGDTLDDISLEARRQLYKQMGEDKDGTPRYITPPFSAMVSYVLERVNAMPKSRWREVANQPVPFSLVVCDQILIYLEHCLSVEATSKKFSSEHLYWDDSASIGQTLLKIIIEHKENCSPSKTAYPNVVDQYLGFTELVANAWSAQALKSILRIVAVIPRQMAYKYDKRLDWIKKFIVRGGQYGQIAAHLFGVITGQFHDVGAFENAMQQVIRIKDLRVESQESCLLAQGYGMCYKLHLLKRANVLPPTWQLFEKIVLNLVNQLAIEINPMQSSVLTALTEISRHAPLPLPLTAPERTPSAKYLVELLINIYNKKKLSSKIREQAIMASSYLCVGDPNFILKVEVLEALLKLSKESNELEIHFAVGEALTDCILGPESSAGLNPWTESEHKPTKKVTEESMDDDVVVEELEKDSDEMMEKEEKLQQSDPVEEMDLIEASSSVTLKDDEYEKGTLEWLLNTLLRHYTTESHPSCRQASCIWVLALLKRCKDKPAIQKFLPLIQATFMNFLGDNNDLIQDAASKGLGVVYECCNEETRQSMVESLIQTLAVGRKHAVDVKVTKDTKIFEEGELGKAPSGGHLSTYRELCSLATDLNQPELIYKFMNLANHNAVWASRKGAAFGFSSLASQAGSQLEPYLPQIIPKLYRYQHDPTPKIQQPMQSIWNSLVQDSSKTIDKYYEAIMTDLLNNFTHNTWRVRESCCNAMCDLLRRSPVSAAIEQVAEIWNILFRVRDDIKESVRTASDKCLQTLSKSCIKLCETPSTESEALLKQVLPILLTTGITSSVSEVREISINTLVKLCRQGGTLVKPHLGTLIPALLEALSGLEHRSLSYTAVRVDDENRVRLDTARVLASKSTPMMDTLNFVLQFVDEDVLESVVSGTIDVLKRSVGLSSRAGAAHVVETLTHTCPGPLEKYTGKFLSAFVAGLGDRNVVVRKTFANAIGTVIKTAKSSSIEKLLSRLKSWYLEKDETAKVSASLALRSMHLQNGDIMKNYASQALPLAFLAMHADTDSVWTDIWNDNTPGTEAAIRLYVDEILNICELALNSTSWDTKAQAGKALSTVVNKVTLSDIHLLRTFQLLSSGLQGRTWNGKESLVTALSDLCLNSKTVGNLEFQESTVLDTSVTILTRESRKEKMEYKCVALKGLTQVLECHSVDKFEVIFDICLPYLALEKESKDETEDAYSKESLRWQLVDEMIHSLGRAWPATKITQEKFSDQVIEMLSASVSRVPRKSQLSIMKALRSFWKQHFFITGLPETMEHPLMGALIHFTCKIFNFCLGIAKFYSLRREALVVLNELLEPVKSFPAVVNRLKIELISSVEEAKRDAQPDVQSLASSAYKILVNV